MKKYLSFILAIILFLSLSSCRKAPAASSSGENSVTTDFVYVTSSESFQNKENEEVSQQETTSQNEENTPQRTVIAPITVTLYKGGKQSISTDKEFNYQIAMHIKGWYDNAGPVGISCNCVSNDADVLRIKNNETAIELEFDEDVDFYSMPVSAHARKVFIPLTGDMDYVIFSTGKSAGTWHHYYPPHSGGLEEYFEGREYEEISNERWKSTITAPARIQLYKNGELLEEHTDWDFNIQVAEYIESWYLYETSIDSGEDDAYMDVVKRIRDNDTYLEIIFHSEIKIYGETLFSPETYCLLIPLTGEGAGCVFEAGKDYNYTKAHCPEHAQKLDHFFESLNAE